MPSFRINRVYTRTGDDGTTALVGGKRVSKSDARVVAYGEIDELNTVLGLVAVELSEKTNELAVVIANLQQELFNIGAELASPSDAQYEGMIKVSDREVTALENLCDKFAEGLPELKSFILPGGSRLAANLHLARVVARRAERAVVLLSEEGKKEGGSISLSLLKYVNRLSDLFFILARWSLRAEGRAEVLWKR